MTAARQRLAGVMWRTGERLKRARWDRVAFAGYRIMARADRIYPWERP